MRWSANETLAKCRYIRLHNTNRLYRILYYSWQPIGKKCEIWQNKFAVFMSWTPLKVSIRRLFETLKDVYFFYLQKWPPRFIVLYCAFVTLIFTLITSAKRTDEILVLNALIMPPLRGLWSENLNLFVQHKHSVYHFKRLTICTNIACGHTVRPHAKTNTYVVPEKITIFFEIKIRKTNVIGKKSNTLFI